MGLPTEPPLPPSIRVHPDSHHAAPVAVRTPAEALALVRRLAPTRSVIVRVTSPEPFVRLVRDGFTHVASWDHARPSTSIVLPVPPERCPLADRSSTPWVRAATLDEFLAALAAILAAWERRVPPPLDAHSK